MEFELHSSVISYFLDRAKERKAFFMGLPKLFTREVFIRLEDDETFATTVKYGRFFSKTEELKVAWGASATLQESVSPGATYLVPPATMPPKDQRCVRPRWV